MKKYRTYPEIAKQRDDLQSQVETLTTIMDEMLTTSNEIKAENELLKAELEKRPKPVYVLYYCHFYSDRGYGISNDWMLDGKLLLWTETIPATPLEKIAVYETKEEALEEKALREDSTAEGN